MTRREAYNILGISPEMPMDEIKKRYRQLMHQVHPDSGVSSREAYGYSAQEINIAYEFLSMGESTDEFFNHIAGFHNKKGSAAREGKKDVWSAPLNQNAYQEREILCYAEDYDGAV